MKILKNRIYEEVLKKDIWFCVCDTNLTNRVVWDYVFSSIWRSAWNLVRNGLFVLIYIQSKQSQLGYKK